MSTGTGQTIAKNTIFLYIRLLITVLVSLYTSRVVLQTLGVEDFGIFNVVGGVIAMFSFLNSGMIQASQRFMSYEIGKGNKVKLNDVFSTTLVIHILIAIILLIIVESFGIWFVNNKMNIPEERMIAANWVLHCSLIAFSFVVITVPFNSTIIAHERMGIYAFVSVVDAFLKLGIVYLVQLSSYDKLVTYAVLLLLIPLAELLFYAFYCKRHFQEISFKLRCDKNLFRQILSFAGWSFVGNIGFTVRSQGVNIVINMLCGAVVNAARGIAYQVSSHITSLVANFQMAIIPQITKRYAANDVSGMISLVFKGSKISFFLLYLVALPFCLRAQYVLDLWLGEAPQYTVGFVTLALIASLIDGVAIPIGKAIDATGNIKWFQISLAVVMLLDIPLSYLLLMTGVVPYFVVFVSIFTSILALIVRITIVKRRFNDFSIFSFITNVVVRCLIVVFISFLIGLFFDRIITDNFLGLLLLCIITSICVCVLFYLIGLNKEERVWAYEIVISRIKKNKK